MSDKRRIFVRSKDKSKEKYDVDKIISIMQNGKEVSVNVKELYETHKDKKAWSDGNGNRITITEYLLDPEKFQSHKERVTLADTSYPIILSPNKTIIDGYHRLVKSYINNNTTIKAKLIDDWSNLSGALVSSRKGGDVNTLEDIKVILNKDEIDESDIVVFSNRTIQNKDGSYSIIKPKWGIHGRIKLSKGDVSNLNETVETTIGQALVNRLLKIDPFGNVFPYTPGPLNVNKFINEVTNKILIGEITTEQMSIFFDNVTWLCRFGDMVIPSMSKGIMFTPPKTKALMKKLLEENKEIIEKGDLKYVTEVDDKVLKSLQEELKDDPSMSLFTGSKKPSVKGNLKVNIGTQSPVQDPATGKFRVPKGNLLDGFDVTDMDVSANSAIKGTYERSNATADGGSIVKSLYNALGPIMADKDRDFDCGTKLTRSIMLTKNNAKTFLYMWMVNNKTGNLELLTPDNLDKNIGKRTEFRSTLYCKHPEKNKVCAKCVGDIPYKTELYAVGNLTAKIGFDQVTLSLKSFHDSSVNVSSDDPFKYMIITK